MDLGSKKGTSLPKKAVQHIQPALYRNTKMEQGHQWGASNVYPYYLWRNKRIIPELLPTTLP